MPDQSARRLSRRLLLRYGTVLAVYFGAMYLLWRVGIEAIYQHPTPFYALYRPLWTVHEIGLGTVFYQLAALAAVAAFIAGIFYGARRMRPALSPFEGELRGATDRSTRAVVASIVAFAFIFAAAIAMLRGGPDGIAQGYERPGLEYVYDIGAGGSIAGLFGDYTRIHEHLSAHSRVHPPGPIALLWAMSYVVGRDALPLAIATMLFGVLAIVPLFLWTRDMLGPRVAFATIILYACVPSIVLFTATSADIAFTPFTLGTLFLFWRALDRGSIPYAVFAGIGYAVMSLISFTLLGLGAYFALEGIRRLGKGDGLRRVAQTAAVMIAAFLAVHVALRIGTGFDYIECFRMALASFQHDQAMLDELAPRFGSIAWKFWNPACWFYFAGIPISVLLLERLWHPERKSKSRFIVFALTLLALDILYMARGEGERSALYILPFAVIPAAHMLDDYCVNVRSVAPLAATVGFLTFQTWLTEILFYTYW